MAAVIETPVSGSTMVDLFQPLVIAKRPYAPTAPATATAAIYAQHDRGGDWTTPSAFLSAAATQGAMARASGLGKVQALDFAGGSFGVTTSRIVTDVKLLMQNNVAWPTSPSDLGAGRRYTWMLLSYQGKTREIHYNDRNQFSSGSAPTNHTSKSLVHAFRWLATGREDGTITVADVEALLTDLVVQVIAGDHRAGPGYITDWYAAGLQLQITHYTSAPDQQAGWDFEIDTDAAFSSPLLTGRVWGQGDMHALPAEHLARLLGARYAATTLYLRVAELDSSEVSTDWSSTVTFTTLSEQASRLVHEQSADRVPVYELDFVRQLDCGRWTPCPVDENGNTLAGVWRCPLSRDDFPHHNFFPVDVEEEAIPQAYSNVEDLAAASSVIADASLVGAGYKRFWWDETGRSVLSGGVPTLYVRTRDGRSPAGFHSFGVGLVVSLPLATAPIRSGPGDAYNCEARVRNSPEFGRGIDDLTAEISEASIGTLELANDTGHGDTSDPDDSKNYGFFWNLFALEPNPTLFGDTDTAEGFLFNGRRLRCSLVGATSLGPVRWSERLPCWEAKVRWPSAALLKGPSVSLEVSKISALAEDKVVGDKLLDAGDYPNILDSSKGKPRPEVFGHVQRCPAYVVDTVARKLVAARAATNVTMVYADGVAIPPTGLVWSFNAATGHVLWGSGPGAVAIWDANVNAQWETDIEGPSYGGSTRMTYGKLAQALLQAGGIVAERIVSASFDRVDNLEINFDEGAGLPYELALAVTGDKSQIASHLAVCNFSGSAHVVDRPDGKFIAVEDEVEDWGQDVVVITDYRIIGEPEWSLVTGHMGSTVTLTYLPGSASSPQKLSNFKQSNSVHGLDTVHEFETYHKTQDGALAPVGNIVRRLGQIGVPHKELEIEAGAEGLLAYPGARVLLLCQSGLTDTGKAEWFICQVRHQTPSADGSSVRLRLRRGNYLRPEERPY